MSSSALSISLEIIRLLIRKGDLHEARVKAEDAMKDALILKDRAQWLEATRFYFQCCQELEELGLAQIPMESVISFLVSAQDTKLQAQAEALISSWLLALGKRQECHDYVQSAINKATGIQDFDTLARALTIYAASLLFDAQNFKTALVQLDKLNTILDGLQQPEMQLTANLLRSYIYTQRGQTDLALPLLWATYEQAKIHGFHLLISSILAQIARVYRDQKQVDEYRIYADLALRGLDRAKTPRVYKLVHASCPPLKDQKTSPYDFQVDEKSRAVRECNKGKIDFKNQHILFEMALLFIKNPGHRFNKEELSKSIWNQTYSPDLHDNLIYVSIKRLRTLLEPDLESPKYILRDRKGYYFNPQSIVQFRASEEVTL